MLIPPPHPPKNHFISQNILRLMVFIVYHNVTMFYHSKICILWSKSITLVTVRVFLATSGNLEGSLTFNRTKSSAATQFVTERG